MNYIVLDLEMCEVPKIYRNEKYHYSREIIQVGAVLLDEEYKEIGSICQYVRPEHGLVTPFITRLTGIKQSQVKNAPMLKDILHYMLDWIGDREYKIFAWSDSDYSQFAHEITSKHLEDECINVFMDQDRWIDYQKVFSERFEFQRAVKLEEALMYCDITPKGCFHNGLDDATNTAQMIGMLETHPEYQIYNYEKELEKSAQPIGTLMGDLFAKLHIA